MHSIEEQKAEKRWGGVALKTLWTPMLKRSMFTPVRADAASPGQQLPHSPTLFTLRGPSGPCVVSVSDVGANGTL